MKDKKPAPATVVLLVRHGLTPTTGVKLPGRARGLPLSAEGRRPAEAAAPRRARAPAAIIAKARNMAVRIERGLLELDIGKWTGLALKDAGSKPEWKAVQQHPSGFRFDGGGSDTERQG